VKVSDGDFINIDTIKWPARVFGIEMRQNLYSIQAMSKLIEGTPGISRIIEFGTGTGIMTLLMSIYANDNNVELYTYDILPMLTEGVRICLSEMNNTHVSNCDIFNSESSISELITTTEGRVLILCDNGDKKREFEMYSKYLRPNDIICAHDYFFDGAESNNGTETWVCCEITYKDIKEYCEMYNIVTYMDEVMKSSHWGCFIKDL